MLLTEPDTGLMHWVTRQTAGPMLRHLLPVTVVISSGPGIDPAGLPGLTRRTWAKPFALATVIVLAFHRPSKSDRRVDYAPREQRHPGTGARQRTTSWLPPTSAFQTRWEPQPRRRSW
jgi:hypothetical protein